MIVRANIGVRALPAASLAAPSDLIEEL